MSIRTFFYTLRQGFLNIFRNKWFTLASLATITACLFVFGAFFSIAMNLSHLLATAEKGVSVTVFFDEGLPQEDIDRIGVWIDARDEVADFNLVTAEEAWEEFSKELGENAEGFTENPLQNSANYQIYLKDVTKQKQLVNDLEKVEGVRKVNRSDFLANFFSGVGIVLTYISVGMIAILLAVSIFLISNTVTIGISVRRAEITVMKYIGATDFFVRAPFVWECMIIGLVGSLIPVGVLYFVYGIVVDFITTEIYTLIPAYQCLSVSEVFIYLLPVSVIVGVGIGFIGSFFTVRKHLKV